MTICVVDHRRFSHEEVVSFAKKDPVAESFSIFLGTKHLESVSFTRNQSPKKRHEAISQLFKRVYTPDCEGQYTVRVILFQQIAPAGHKVVNIKQSSPFWLQPIDVTSKDKTSG